MTIYLDSHPIAIDLAPPFSHPPYASFRLTSASSLATCHTPPSDCRFCPFSYDCSAGTLKPRILSHLHANYPELFL